MSSDNKSSSNSRGSGQNDPWLRSAVLSLDGSGLQVLSTLIILKELMTVIKEVESNKDTPATSSADSPLIESTQVDKEFEELIRGWNDDFGKHRKRTTDRFLPCHYFDFVAGTSTGGVLALMLGRLRMSVDTTLLCYRELLPQLQNLRQNTTRFMKHPQGRLTWYLSRLKPPSMEKVQTKTSRIDFAGLPRLGGVQIESSELRCKTIVFSFCLEQNGQPAPYCFRSYNKPESTSLENEKSSQNGKYYVLDVARAACSNPFSYSPVSIHNRSFYDTGFVLTNPSKVVVQELVEYAKLTEGIQTTNPIALLVSIGSGYRHIDRTARRWAKHRKPNLQGRVNRALWNTSESVHHNLTGDDERGFEYFRLNLELDLRSTLEDLDDDDFNQKRVDDLAQKFSESLNFQEGIRQVANKLVDLRRRRCETRRWEAFAFGWHYDCTFESCENESQRFKSRGDFMDHLYMIHDLPPIDSQFYSKYSGMINDARKTTV